MTGKSRWLVIVVFTVIATVAAMMYSVYSPPEGLEAMSATDKAILQISFWTAVASATAAFFTLVKSVLDFFRGKK